MGATPIFMCKCKHSDDYWRLIFAIYKKMVLIIKHIYSPLQVFESYCWMFDPLFQYFTYLCSWPLFVKHFRCLSDYSIPWKKCSGADFQLVELPCYISCASDSRELPKGEPMWLCSVSREWSLYFKLSHPFSFPWATQPFPSLKQAFSHSFTAFLVRY